MSSIFDTPDSPLWVESQDYVSGGYDNSTEAHLLPPNVAAKLLNSPFDVTGRLQKRQGAGKMGTAGTGNPNGLFPFDDERQDVQALVGVWGGEVYSSAGLATDWTRRASGVSLPNTFHMASQGQGLPGRSTLFVHSCVGVSSNVSQPFGRILCLDSGWGATSISDNFRASAWFQNRLWGFNTNEGNTILKWSKVLDGRDFSNAQTVEIEPNSGDPGVAIVPMRDGSPRLLLFKERSIHALDIVWATDGYYPLTANALDFTKSRLLTIAAGTGCVATRSLVWVPGQQQADILFLSREGIRSLSRSATDAQGGTPPPLSERISDTIRRINWDAANRASAVFWDRTAYFAVPVDGAEYNNHIIAYDTTNDAFFEVDWDAAAWAPARIFNSRRFFFMGSSAVTETGIGSPASGVSYGYHVYEAFETQTDPGGLPVDFDVVTRAFDFSQSSGGQPGTGLRFRKKWNYLDLAIQSAATGASISLQYKVDDDDDWSTLRTLYVDPQDGYPSLPVQLPFNFSIGRVLRRSFMLRDIRPGYKLQFRLRDNSSFARLKILSIAVAANPVNPKFNSVT